MTATQSAHLALAIVAARLVRLASRTLRRGGGSSYPGLLGRRLAPDAVAVLAHRLPAGVVVVAGTNGKTTTSRMLASILRTAGLRPLHNRDGANLLSGVATALLTNSSLRGRPSGDIGLFEVDEASVPVVVGQAQPRVALLLNLFRDQLDRYGELDRLAGLWRASLFSAGSDRIVVANADDPGVAALAADAPGAVLWYGIEDTSAGVATLSDAADALHCQCGAALVYDALLYAHLGHWRCPHCGRKRPLPDVFVTDVKSNGLEGSCFRLSLRGETVEVSIPLPGLYNVVNAAAAAAAATALNLPGMVIRDGLRHTTAAFGRLERIDTGDQELVLWLVKNPAGFNESLRTLLAQSGPKTLVLAINDRIADGQDISWLWDVDFEALADSAAAIHMVVCAGTRAHDMAVRLKYAGFPPERQRTRVDLQAAVQLAREAATTDAPLFVFCTYTAMLELRAAFARRGWVRPMWES